MKKITLYFLLLVTTTGYSQEKEKLNLKLQDTITPYKKRILETTEIDILTSYYTQDGKKAAITGGVGDEELVDLALNINVAIPLNEDDVFSIDATVSAYTSASSSNLNPFTMNTIGSPWVAGTGASKSDIWASGNFGYSHSSEDRNSTYNASLNFAKEYDYTSIGTGFGYTKLLNEKNTSISASINIYLDSWNPQFPIELNTYTASSGNLNSGIFNGRDILDQNGNIIDKNNPSIAWRAFKKSNIPDKKRNTYSLSLSFSQLLSNKSQFSIFSDLVIQKGWLANPSQRVYFGDIANYYIGNPTNIPFYTTTANKDLFHLADDIERLPESRIKIPIGIRFNHYINTYLILKTYYRYYFDDWGISAHTLNLELPIKISQKFTLYPNYRFYNQTQTDYFAPYDQLTSTSNYYTSDNDLSKYNANQFGLGIKYKDILYSKHLWIFGLKNVTINYNYYKRNTGLNAHIFSFGTKFIIDK